MSVTTHIGTWKYKDSKGNIHILKPISDTDTTLSESGKAADAAAVGDKFNALYKHELVDELPSDAAEHTDTFYYIREKVETEVNEEV